MFTVEVVSLQNEFEVNKIKSFLQEFNLDYDEEIDYTVVIMEQEKIVGTASKQENVLKCFAVSEPYQGLGIVNLLVKAIEDKMFKEGIYQFFIYTLSCNKAKFESIGYKEIISDQNISILENGIYNIENYLQKLKSENNISDHPKACIIMNANPFTLGHRYLIEQASRENKEVIVFIVSEDKSYFPFSARFQLVKEGIKDLTNIKVIETGPYLVSNATFPTYFLKEKKDVVAIHARLDCAIFLKYYKKVFNLTSRYVGNEPICVVTNTYNTVMKELLPSHGVELKVIERIKSSGEVISASRVRELLSHHKYDELKLLVPDSTYNYLIDGVKHGSIRS